jgi:hypothetical protein
MAGFNSEAPVIISYSRGPESTGKPLNTNVFRHFITLELPIAIATA